jgi:uncharacterized protein YggU (UPF0235/DUF167 family)
MEAIERTAEGVRLHGDMVCIRVAAPPVDGAANEELVIVSGQSSRSKVVEITGLSPQDVAARLGV